MVLAALVGADVCEFHDRKLRTRPCASSENMCDCSGFAASAFQGDAVIFESDSSKQLDGYSEGTCGYANAACDLKWSVLCCDQGDLEPEGLPDFQPVDEARSLQAVTFETAEDFCERNGFALGSETFDVERVAFPGEGFVGFTGHLDGTCGNVLADSMSQFAQCCCVDESFCCPQGEDSDDCLSKDDSLGSSGSFSFSYVLPDPSEMCPHTDGLDMSVCFEGGFRDDECCAMPGNATCAPGYMHDTSELSSCGDGKVFTCCYNNCTDSATWHKNDEPSKDCDWVAEFVPQRCDVKGADRSLASYSCPRACGTSCHDDLGWHKTDEPDKGCAWVSAFSEARCDTKGEDGTLASYSCPTACDMMVESLDDEDWHKTDDTTKDCAWVSSFATARCDAKGADGTLAYEKCLRACHGVSIAA